MNYLLRVHFMQFVHAIHRMFLDTEAVTDLRT